AAALSRKALLYFNPALNTTQRLISEVLRDQGTFTDLVVTGSRVVASIAQRRDALSSLIGHANTTAGAIAAEYVSFSRTLQLLTLARVAGPVFKRARQTIVKSIPVATFIRPYAPDFTQWLRDFGEGANTYDANGHYARIQPIFNAYSFNDNANTLTPISTAG